MKSEPTHLWRAPALDSPSRDLWSARSRRVLLVVPHPDDESYGCAGTLARLAADPDCAVAMLILTSGEAATIARERGIAPEEFARIREERLERVRGWLGIDTLFLARLPDGGLARLPLARLAEAIGSAIEQLDPQVVLGHDPRGVNAHPDHIAAHWALRVALEGSKVRRFAMMAHDAESARAALPRVLFSTPPERIHCTVALSDDEIALKERCLCAHEAVVTLDPERAAREEMWLRPAIEEWEFFGEPSGFVVPDLFSDLPTRSIPV